MAQKATLEQLRRRFILSPKQLDRWSQWNKLHPVERKQRPRRPYSAVLRERRTAETQLRNRQQMIWLLSAMRRDKIALLEKRAAEIQSEILELKKLI